ncbi:MAG: hypothetical protein P9L92_06400 [Candidatus Electryonea clarkiae]|nr:hypothetical protein [Candidatus Electryonea clarkiae]MDP8286338.1 hypothetical protein [Candidatus Electryonea clarkiae]
MLKRVLFILTSCLSFSLFAQPPQLLPRLPLDAEELFSQGIVPRVTIDSGDERTGRFRIADNPWWMFFLHLRPLKNSPELSEATARDIILNFWSGSSDATVELTGKEGVLQPGREKVFWVEAIYMNGAVKTRFFIWDEPMYQRRVIADCNINLRRGTPDSLLYTVQEQIAFFAQSGIGYEKLSPPEYFSMKTDFAAQNIRLLHPHDSRASLYTGFDEKRGDHPADQWSSIWILPVGIDWRFDLEWGPFEEEEPEEWIVSLLPDKLEGNATVKADSITLIEVFENQWTGELRITTSLNNQNIESFWKFSAATWIDRGRTFRTIAASQVYRNWWGVPFDGVIDVCAMNEKTSLWFESIYTAPKWKGCKHK